MRYLLTIKNEKGEMKVAHFGRTDKSFEELIVEFTTFYSSEANLKALKKGISHCKFFNDKDIGLFLKDLLSGKKTAMEHFTKYCDPEVGFSELLTSLCGVKKEVKLYTYAKYVGDFMFADALFEIDFAKNRVQYSTTNDKNFERWK